jgi:YidC/Oxa1 family membrane protein insertase
MIDLLYTIIIYPLYTIIEVFYNIIFVIFENSGISIIFVSVAVTVLSLPLYIVAEKWQQVERDITKKLKPKVDKIRKCFKGDEQYFILSTYYRQNHYHPVYALRNSVGILIQIPFFIAAYNFLSNLMSIRGDHFLFIKDLGTPDKILYIGSFGVNILPVLMTVINIISSAIYTKNLSARDKIQLYAVSGVFLILLYNSPSGLVLYWTMNNVFSLIKNIFYKIKNPKLILYILSLIGVFIIVFFLLFVHTGDIFNRLTLSIILLIIPFLPLINKFTRKQLDSSYLAAYAQKRFPLFILSITALCLLVGFVIPSYLIVSSPQEFSFINDIKSPFSFLASSFFQALGLFVFWPLCIYFLFDKKIQSLLSMLTIILCFTGLINTFLFSGDYGEISTMLAFSDAGRIKPLTFDLLVNISVLLCTVALIFTVIYFKKIKIILTALVVIILAQASVSAVHSFSIEKEYRRYVDIIEQSPQNTNITKSLNPIFHFSKEGKNVVVIMLDRAINGFIPEIFSESPDLHEKYSGFVYYPNTLSFNGHTLMGAPPLFGGYEYTPDEINKRSTEPLVKKHNESLLLMPKIFLDSKFSVTVTDPAWANYSWIPDTRIYREYPEISVYNTKGAYTDIWLEQNSSFDSQLLQLKSQFLKRNIIWFSFFKVSPFLLRDAIYKNGEYWNTDKSAIDYNLFLDNYTVLDFLPKLTDTAAASLNNSIIMVNDLTHEPNFLQAPDYFPKPEVTNYGKSKFSHIVYYPTNAAAIKRLGTWFDFLKQNDVYDNTRIIIVSDHGAEDIDIGIFHESNAYPFHRENFNPLLLVKDFGGTGPLFTDYSFMTNADVPALAFRDLIPNPVNPFTGNPVRVNKDSYVHITTANGWEPAHHSRNTFTILPDEWYSVKDNIFLDENWIKGRK